MTRTVLSQPPEPTTARARELGLSTSVLSTALDRDDHTSALVNLLAHNLTWGQSTVFRRMFGLGTNEWRVISALSKYPGATASQLCEIFRLNKSIVSKSVNVLLGRELIENLEGRRGSRHLYLTAAGVVVHDEMATVALKMQEILHSELSADEVVQANSLIARMLLATQRLQDYRPATPDAAPTSTR